jgi:RNA polymerase primary sigma factor
LGSDHEHTLEEIGHRLSVTRERVRQIEARAIAKIRAARHHAA